jgi:uncharacterized protein with PIN domain/sulfur carrier protein ThiS
MVTATFRFYGELNAFLAPARRQGAFTAPCAQNATVKHMVEALGVPHTEVALALLNGEAAPLGRLLRDGDRLAVYPCFARFGIAAPAPPAWRFVADAHLGGLARLLRMAGFDTLYDNGMDDAAIAAVAAAQSRVVLTRDRELLKRRGVGYGCYVHALRPAGQLAEVAGRLDLAAHAAPFTLCLHCNAPLREVARELVLDRLPETVRAHHRQFSTCDLCHRVYWKGSHWKRMCALLDESLAMAVRAPDTA